MFKIFFIDDALSCFDLGNDISVFSQSFFENLSLYAGKGLTILDPNGDLVATCFDGSFIWY